MVVGGYKKGRCSGIGGGERHAVRQGKCGTREVRNQLWIGRRAGVVSCGDMTLEASLTKLMFLLGQSEDADWVRDQMATNLKGELSIR